MRKVLIIGVLTLAIALLFTIGAFAQTKTVLVSKNIKGANWEPDIAADEKGNAVVVWVLTAEVNTTYHIYAAYVKAKGNKLKVKNAIRISGDMQQNKYPTIRYQKLSGTFLVVWEAVGVEGQSLQSRELDSSGQPVGAEKTIVTGEVDQYFRPILLAIDGARKLKKSYMLAWYQLAGSSSDIGLWTAMLTSSGDLAKKPKFVFPAKNTNVGGVQIYPTSLTSHPSGGYLLGAGRVESADQQVQQGHVLHLNKAGKKKKAVPVDGGDNVNFVACEAISEDRILVSWRDYNFGISTNQLFDSSLNPVADAYRSYSGVCNGSLFNMVSGRLFQTFMVNFFGFFVAQYDADGMVKSPPTFVEAEYPLHGISTSVTVPGTDVILIATMRVHTSLTDHRIYCIKYDVPE